MFLKKLLTDMSTGSTRSPISDPRRGYRQTIVDNELTEIESNARAASSVDEVDLDLE